MGWAAIIGAIISVFGPMLLDWLKQLVERWLSDAAARLGEPVNGSGHSVGSLFDNAINHLPRFAFGRRVLIRRLKAHAVEHEMELLAIAKTGKSKIVLSDVEIADIDDAQGAASNEILGA